MDERTDGGGPVIDVTGYLILVNGAGDESGNCSAWSPDVPGCVATGASVETCVLEMRAALEFHLETLQTDGQPIPEPTGPGVYVEHPDSAAARRSVGDEQGG